MYQMQLWTKLKNKPYCNDFHFFLIGVILFLLSLRFKVFFLLLFVYLFFIYKRIKLLYPLIIFIGIFFIRFIANEIRCDFSDENYSIKVSEIEDNSFIGYVGLNKIMVNYYNHSYIPGDIISCNIVLLDIDQKSYKEDFDYELYLKSESIKYYARIENDSKISSAFTFSKLKYNINNFYKDNLNENSYNYVKAIVLGDNDLNDEIKEGYSLLSISHILAISGFHIMLLFKVICFIIFNFFKSYKTFPAFIIITIYVILIGAPSSALRALLFLYIIELNKKGPIKYTNLDILSISCLIMLLINPYSLYNTGFILSYLVSFLLIFMKEFIHVNSKLLSSYLTHYLIYFATLPFVANITNIIYILSFIASPILSILATVIIIPLSYIVALFPFLNNLIDYIFLFFNNIILGLSVDFFKINIISFNMLTGFIYYILFFIILVMLSIKRKVFKYHIIFIGYLLLLVNIKLVNPINKITFIDVGQGDSALIELSHNRGTMLIDAYNCYDYLKRRGIKQIDYLVLSHSDNDHIGDLEDILNHIKVDNIICSKYDSDFRKSNYILVDYNSSFYLDDIRIDILSPIIDNNDDNSNSIVLKFYIEGFSFLFTADIGIEEEKLLVEKYNKNLQSNVLKVSHHGASTSSDLLFLQYVKPDYSIISAGKENKYNHPNIEVLKRLNNISTVYETSKKGNITFNIYKNKIWIDTYR